MLVDYAHSWMDGTLFVWCQTDIPCHLWLRWTDKEERMHLTQKERRGATHMSDPYYCFVEWNEVEALGSQALILRMNLWSKGA